ncbi:hypothetical protein D041_0635B, partial [Vibrio parahaemolyticus EKP-008]
AIFDNKGNLQMTASLFDKCRT